MCGWSIHLKLHLSIDLFNTGARGLGFPDTYSILLRCVAHFRCNIAHYNSHTTTQLPAGDPRGPCRGTGCRGSLLASPGLEWLYSRLNLTRIRFRTTYERGPKKKDYTWFVVFEFMVLKKHNRSSCNSACWFFQTNGKGVYIYFRFRFCVRVELFQGNG